MRFVGEPVAMLLCTMVIGGMAQPHARTVEPPGDAGDHLFVAT